MTEKNKNTLTIHIPKDLKSKCIKAAHGKKIIHYILEAINKQADIDLAERNIEWVGDESYYN